MLPRTFQCCADSNPPIHRSAQQIHFRKISLILFHHFDLIHLTRVIFLDVKLLQ